MDSTESVDLKALVREYFEAEAEYDRLLGPYHLQLKGAARQKALAKRKIRFEKARAALQEAAR